MNKEFMYFRGKAIVSDTEGNLSEREYCDNINEVLEEENLIESLENKKEKLEERSLIYSEKNNEPFFPKSILKTFSTILIGQIAFWLLFVAGFVHLPIGIDFFDLLKNITLIAVSVSVPIATLFDIVDYKEHKKSLKIEAGINKELEFLNEQLSVETEKLNIMKSNVKKETESEQNEFVINVVKKLDSKKLKELRELLVLYFDLGYSQDKYEKYNREGKLIKKLSKNYTYEGIKLIKSDLEKTK